MPRSPLLRAGLASTVLVFTTVACDPAPQPDAASGDLVVERTVQDGVEHVRNLSGSVWPAPAHLEPIATIGGVESEEYMFASPTAVWATPDMVLVADGRAAAARAYDRSGNYLRTYGRSGEGPGEFEMIMGVGITPEREVAVLGLQKVAYFSLAGEFLREWRVPIGGAGYALFAAMPVMTGDGGIFRLVGRLDPDAPSRDEMDRMWVRVGPDGWTDETILEPTFDIEQHSLSLPCPSGQGDCWYGAPYRPQQSRTLLFDRSLVVARGDRYELRLSRPDGSSMVIERIVEPRPVSDEERLHARLSLIASIRRGSPQFAGEGIEIPTHKPPVSAFVTSRDDRIYVARETGSHWNTHRCGPKSEWTEELDAWDCLDPEFEVDVFAPDGRYLGFFPRPAQARVTFAHIDGRELWCPAIAPDGNYVIQGYRLVIPPEP